MLSIITKQKALLANKHPMAMFFRKTFAKVLKGLKEYRNFDNLEKVFEH